MTVEFTQQLAEWFLIGRMLLTSLRKFFTEPGVILKISILHALYFPGCTELQKTCVSTRVRKNPVLNQAWNSLTCAEARDSVEETAVRDESRREIYKAVMSLPPQHREIIILKHFDECSYEEIADILDIPKGTVMSRLYNARKLLKSKLEAEYEL